MNERILVVDDDPNSLALMAYLLELEGYAVVQAEDGGQALEAAQAASPDLMVLDVMLPDISGLEVCRQIRADPRLSQLKVLMLSAKAENIDQDRGLQAGADRYLTKPAEPEAVISSIRDLLD